MRATSATIGDQLNGGQIPLPYVHLLAVFCKVGGEQKKKKDCGQMDACARADPHGLLALASLVTGHTGVFGALIWGACGAVAGAGLRGWGGDEGKGSSVNRTTDAFEFSNPGHLGLGRV